MHGTPIRWLWPEGELTRDVVALYSMLCATQRCAICHTHIYMCYALYAIYHTKICYMPHTCVCYLLYAIYHTKTCYTQMWLLWFPTRGGDPAQARLASASWCSTHFCTFYFSIFVFSNWQAPNLRAPLHPTIAFFVPVEDCKTCLPAAFKCFTSKISWQMILVRFIYALIGNYPF